MPGRRRSKGDTKPGRRATSTRSTAGAGFEFEDLFAADALSRGLTDQPAFGLDAPVRRVLSQTNALWLIDDLLLVAGKQRLAVSCKSNVQVSSRGFPKDFAALAWAQWRAPPFDQLRDRIGLVTRGQEKTFLPIWHDIKSWAAGDAELAIARVRGLKSHEVVFDSLRSFAGIDGRAGDAEALRLIQRLEVIATDFQLLAEWEGHAVARLRQLLSSADLEEARKLWSDLVERARKARLGDGTIDIAKLWPELRQAYRLNEYPNVEGDWRRLDAISSSNLAVVQATLPSGLVLTRTYLAGQIEQGLADRKSLLILGDSGVGKSAAVKAALAVRPDTKVVWLDPEAVSGALHASSRGSLGLLHQLGDVLEASRSAHNMLVIDAAERIAAQYLPLVGDLVAKLLQDVSKAWSIIVIAQPSSLDDRVRTIAAQAGMTIVNVGLLEPSEVRRALISVPSLAWLASSDEVVTALANAKTLAWVLQSASAFAEGGKSAASEVVIADRLFQHWSAGSASLRRLMMRLAEREADYERSFRLSEIDGADAAEFDRRPPQAPLSLNQRNRIEFAHDLAADWCRFQMLKEIADEIPRWAALASRPLWIPAIRLLGQYLLRLPPGGELSWDDAFGKLASIPEAADLLLDALCLDPASDHYLAERTDMLLAGNGQLLNRALKRFLHVATVPDVSDHLPVDPELRLYLEATWRRPIIGRWGGMCRFLASNADRIAATGSATVSELCQLWLTKTPIELSAGKPFPFRQALARIAIATARQGFAECIAYNSRGGRSEADQLAYTAALAGAPDVPDEVAAFALEVARRRPLSASTLEVVEHLQAEQRARVAALPKRAPRSRPPAFISAFEPKRLPPWPDGARGRLDYGFRQAVTSGSAMMALARVRPDESMEALLACLIEDQPRDDRGGSYRIERNLGIADSHQSYPTIYWNSPFYSLLPLGDAVLGSLLKFVDFATARWAASGDDPPSVTLKVGARKKRRFYGNQWVFGWSQESSLSSGQLFCALDALERWLAQRLDAGEDISEACGRILEQSRSIAVLGVLVNVGKYRPDLLRGTLAPLAEVPTLYLYDDTRSDPSNLFFDGFNSLKWGEPAYSLARGWRFASHRKTALRVVVARLVRSDQEFAARLKNATGRWPSPEGEHAELAQRVLAAELDAQNYGPPADDGSAEISYPASLIAEVEAVRAKAVDERSDRLIAQSCVRAINSRGSLTSEAAKFLSETLEQLPDGDAGEDGQFLRAAAATALVVNGKEWLADNLWSRERAFATIRGVIDAEFAATDRPSAGYSYNQRLAVAATGAVHGLCSDEANTSDWGVAISSVLLYGEGGGIGELIVEAYRLRDQLQGLWWGILSRAIEAAAVDMLAPRFDGDEDAATHWLHWRDRLRRSPIRRLTAQDLDPLGVAQRAVRLMDGRERVDFIGHRHRRDSRPTGGLNGQIMQSAFSWLLNRELPVPVGPEAAVSAMLLERLWRWEAWRMRATIDEREETETPSQLGYDILHRAPAIILAAPKADGERLWRAIIEIGPEGHYAVSTFFAGWFLELYKAPDAECFLHHWRLMLDAVLRGDWGQRRRFYRSRDLGISLLGLNATSQLQAAPEVLAALPSLEEHYRLWSQSWLDGDDGGIRALAGFLGSPAGRAFRGAGLQWIADAIQRHGQLRDKQLGLSVSDMLLTIITEETEALRDRGFRDLVIAIVAKLVAAEVRPALILQQKLRAL